MDASAIPDTHDANNDTHVSISVFFPCHNEAASIEPLVEKTLSVLESITSDYEVIIVDDGSTDRTPQIADELAKANPNVRTVRHETNLGYGAALQSGFRTARKQLVFYTDGDGQFDIAELPPLVPLIEQYDIVSCYRKKRTEGILRKFNAFCWGKLVNIVFQMKLKDIDCAFKLYKREIFDNIKMQSTGALIDAEVLARALRKGYTVTQTPVSHYPRLAGQSSGANIAVILRAFKELLNLRKDIISDTK